MKIFISQPMRGKTEQQILDERMKAVTKVSELFNDKEVIIAESYQKDLHKNANPLYCLSKSLELMSKCDLVVFVEGYQNARGCKIEHECAKEYGYGILYL